jgi:type 1 glutamine amidotransferase
MKFHRRQFIKHLARGAVGIGAAPILGGGSATVFAASSKKKPLSVCMLSGSEEYKSNESLSAFQKFVEKKYPVKCSRAFWKSKNDLPGLESLDSCDVMLVFTKRLELPKDQLERIKKYCYSGRPIVGVRTASHAFQNWLELDREFFGGDYKGHYGSGPACKVATAKGAAKNPVLAGFKPFETPTKLYKNPHIAADTHLLLTGSIPDHTEPVAWTREYRRARIFYTSLGAPADFENELFRNLLINAIHWTAGRNRTS